MTQWKEASPSRRDGLSFDEELTSTAKGVQFVTRMSAMLRLPAQTIFVASLFLHRFYALNSLKRQHPYQTAACCVFLACKTEESPRKLKDVAVVATKSALKIQKPRSEVEKEYAVEVDQWVKVIPTREDELLQTLKFDFNDVSPYDHLDQLVKDHVREEDQRTLGNMATMFINDSCRTLLGLVLPMQSLAAVSLYWAALTADVSIPDVDGKKWFADIVAENTIVESINDMADMIAIVRNGVLDGQRYDRIEQPSDS